MKDYNIPILLGVLLNSNASLAEDSDYIYQKDLVDKKTCVKTKILPKGQICESNISDFIRYHDAHEVYRFFENGVVHDFIPRVPYGKKDEKVTPKEYSEPPVDFKFRRNRKNQEDYKPESKEPKKQYDGAVPEWMAEITIRRLINEHFYPLDINRDGVVSLEDDENKDGMITIEDRIKYLERKK